MLHGVKRGVLEAGVFRARDIRITLPQLHYAPAEPVSPIERPTWHATRTDMERAHKVATELSCAESRQAWHRRL